MKMFKKKIKDRRKEQLDKQYDGDLMNNMIGKNWLQKEENKREERGRCRWTSAARSVDTS